MHYGLRFNYNSIHVCCNVLPGPILSENFEGKDLNWETITQKRLEAIENCKRGIIPDNCKGCIHLREEEWQEHKQIDEIFLLHWLHCNCSCVYCVNSHYTGGKVTRRPKDSDYYNVYPLLKDAVKKGQISKEVTIHCLGGESAVLKEMDKILKLFIKNGLRYVFCVTSAIDYIKPMKDVFKKYDGQVVISLDSGCSETYKKIKRVDKFNAVVSNIKRYLKDANGDTKKVMVKYILTEGYNDSKEEIDKFFKLLTEIGVKQTRVDIDYKKTIDGEHGALPQHFYELRDYFFKKAEENQLEIHQYPYMDKMFEEGHY